MKVRSFQKYNFNQSLKLILLWNVLFCLGLSVYSVLYNLYLMEFISLNMIGRISGTSYFSYAIFSVIGGLMADKFGPKRVLQVGIVVLIIGYIGGLTTSSPLLLCMWGIVIGMGQSFTNTMFVPLLTEHSSEQERVKLFSLAFGSGNLFMFFGTLGSGIIADKLASTFSLTAIHSFQMVIISASVVLFMSGIPLMMVKPNKEKNQTVRKRLLSPFSWNTHHFVVKFTGVKLIEGIGNGLSIPYINLFLVNRFDLASSHISLFMSGAVLMTVIMIFINPYITTKYGEMKVIFILQTIAIPCLITLAFSVNIWICAISFLCFRALLFAMSPIQSKIVMGKTSQHIRGLTHSVGFMASMVGIGIAGPLSMQMVSSLGNYYGYGLAFTIASLCLGAAVLLFNYFFGTPQKVFNESLHLEKEMA
ncbi:MFS transporter [Neobacillus sp. D3-1R]|uniref:MFS transporter n=1 Tax=Neobacillus sp. D3-1R TaxID=3445778 RepID=UPI003F9FD625